MKKYPQKNPIPQDAKGNLILEMTSEPIPRPNLKRKISYKQKERIYLALWEAFRVVERVDTDSRQAMNFFVTSMSPEKEFSETQPEMEHDLAVYADTLKNLKAAIKMLQ